MNLLLYFSILLTAAEAARFLGFFSMPAPSHHFIYRPVMEELAKKGHDVTYVTTYPYKELPMNITQIDLSKYNVEVTDDIDGVSLSEQSLPMFLVTMHKFLVIMAQQYLQTKEVQDLIHSDQKFDAVLFESNFYQEYLTALIHKFDAIGIEVITLGDYSWTNELAGLPDNPAYQLDFMSAQTAKMDFLQRLYNVYVTGYSTLCNYYYLHYVTQPIVDQHFRYPGWESRPPIDVLVKNKSLILVNFDVLFGYPYPVPPHRKDIGGINIKPNKPLPEDIQKFMDDGKDGVIYMSLGSNMNTSELGAAMSSFMAVFKTLPQRVLLKYEKQFPGEVPPNVKMSKWLPQQDILAHKNCILFITHGGLLSIAESTYHAIPIIGIPFFSDQAKNVVFADAEGFGRLLRYRNITEETVSWTVREVLSNPRYKQEAVRRSKILRERRHTPAEEAVYWIEHSLKYPFALTPKSVDLSPIQLHMIDIKMFIVTVLFVIIYIVYIALRFIKNLISKTIMRKKLKKN